MTDPFRALPWARRARQGLEALLARKGRSGRSDQPGPWAQCRRPGLEPRSPREGRSAREARADPAAPPFPDRPLRLPAREPRRTRLFQGSPEPRPRP
jgi:hypothetical protein